MTLRISRAARAFPPASACSSGIRLQRGIGRLAGTLSEFPKPFGFVLAVNDAALETERFSNVVAVVANVLPAGLGVLPNPVLHIWRLAENVSGVPGLWHLNDHGLLQILSRESGICARFFCEAAVDVADDGQVWGLGG